MYRIPSARRRKGGEERLDLIPILDAVFILIFFLLMSAQFVKIYEIGSDLPILSDAPPPKEDDKKKPLNLTLKIDKKRVQVLTGENSELQQVSTFDPEDKNFGLSELHELLIDFKLKYPKENIVAFIPTKGVPYNTLIRIMDQVRWYKDDDGEGPLFNQIVFDNLVD
jgi:biopolymer transport protein ExbD